MPEPLPKTYAPEAAQAEIDARWAESGAFHAEPDPTRPPYAIVIPPPNVTAALHMGHALNNTLQDILIRWHRMLGDNTMWMPGTDHAGIATQTVVEKRVLAEEGKRRIDHDRDEFVAKIQAWKDQYEARITDQLKAMGCSCDWDRQRFTMDAICAKAVREAFFRLFQDALIYRGKRLVNWDPVTQTALADDEVEMKDVDGFFYYMKYPVVDDAGNPTGEFVTVATTRPETMLGDTAVAVNPNDTQSASFIGKRVKLPLVGRVIPIIGDDHVVIADPESDDAKARFASGFLKVTPAHDPNDWEIGQRHELKAINVMAPDGSISMDHGWLDRAACDAEALEPILGLSREDARRAIVAWFQNNGLLAETREYRHAVGHSYRSHVPIEPYLSDQWYVKVTDDRLAGAALRAMAEDQRGDSEGCAWKSGETFAGEAADWNGGLRFHPGRYAKTFQNWHENIRDWCISRQLWWGHRIPVWTLSPVDPEDNVDIFEKIQAWEQEGRVALISREVDGGTVHVCVRLESDTNLIADLEKAGFVQDPDVLDTWFSSGLWPISTLGWPDEKDNAALQTWNPSSTLCTAREIITLWVSRMVMFNLYFRKCLPFRDVFIHAMIQDGEGQKMSKSLGNGVDPLDIIHSHGADAMRFTLANMTTQTQDVRMPVDTVCPHTGEAFTPKMITNASGHRVAAPVQTCPTDPSKKMVTSYGEASGEARASDEQPLARNTSPKFDGGRNFANKLWNAGRFALGILEAHGSRDGAAAARSTADRWILSRLAAAIEGVNRALADYQFNAYTQTLYDFFWRDLCDWYLEAIKPVAREDTEAGAAARATLAACLDAAVRLLHPAMPYITEKLFEKLNEVASERSIDGLPLPDAELCMLAAWPKPQKALCDQEAEADFATLQNVITAARELRNTYKVPPKKALTYSCNANQMQIQQLLQQNDVISALANITLETATPEQKPDTAASTKAGDFEIYIHDLIDAEAEKAHVAKRQEELIKSRAALQARLNNKGYVDKAPPHLVDETRNQLAEVEKELQSLGCI